MLIIRLLLLAALVVLNGCAQVPEKKGGTPGEPLKLGADAKKTSRLEAKTAIDNDVLFILLSAEIAGQRGHYEIAYQGYMEAAQRVKDPKPAERAAMIAMYLKDGDKLQPALTIWLKNDPENLTARKLALLSALRAKDKKASVEHLDVMLRIDPAGFEATVLELVEALRDNDKAAFFYDVSEALSQKNPNQPAVFYVQSLLAMQMKKKEVAEQKIQQALKIQPDWDKALIFQAQIAILSGEMDKAADILRTAALKYPNNEKINKVFAQVLIKAAEYEEAGAVYQRIIEQNPDDRESQLALGLVLLQMDRDDKAEDIFTQLLEQPKWRQQASFYLGKLEEKHENIKKALVWYDQVTEGPLAFEAPLSAVALLAKNKQYDEAGARLSSLEERFPKQKVRIRILQAELLSQQKQYENAVKLLTDTLVQYPDEKDLLYTRALMAERIGKLDILEADLKKILVNDPDNPEALNALGYTLLDYPARYADAEKYLVRALRLRPDEPVIMDSYGWLQFRLGNVSKALVYLEQAYAKQQENEIAAHLAEVLWALGRKNEAKNLFDKVFKEAPEDEYLLDFQQRVLGGK